MDIKEIKQLIAKNEHISLELKKTTGELKAAMHTACAFLNTDGGWLVFGVAPISLKIIGQEVTDNTQQEIAQALTGIEPAIDVRVEYVDVPNYPGNQVVAIYFETFVWGHPPYTYQGRPYYKIESTTKVMPREMFEERLRASKPQYYAWERQKAVRVGIKDLKEELIRGTIRLGVERGRMVVSAMTEPLEKVLDKLRLLNGDTPNNAAAVLFSNNTYEYPQFKLRMARFRGTDKIEFIDNQRAEGNIFDLLDAGMAFFFKHLSLSGKIAGLVREEHLEIPTEALREALINALCHRQYEKYNLTVGIAIYDDRIEIENPGVFPPQISPEKIKEPHISYPYNPIIADVLFKTTFLENWGSGVCRIMEACKKRNIPEPIWKIQGSFILVTFQRPKQDTSRTQVIPKQDSSFQKAKSKQSPGEFQNAPKQDLSYAQAGPKQDLSLGGSSMLIQHLMEIMQEKTMTMAEMMEAFGRKNRKKFRENYINPALKEGLIERKYPNQPTHPKQMYKLTMKALEWKKKQEELH